MKVKRVFHREHSFEPSPLPWVTPIEFSILISLLTGNLHGLGIFQKVFTLSGNKILLVPGTLYPALKRMSGYGWIEQVDSSYDNDESDERRKYYCLTTKGLGIIESEVKRMEQVTRLARDLLSGKG